MKDLFGYLNDVVAKDLGARDIKIEYYFEIYKENG
jgi:hypothetical protein